MTTPFHTGPTVRTGVGVPPGNLGFDGDYFIDQNDNNTFYGPKQAGQWGALQRFALPNATTGLIGGMLLSQASSTSVSITAGQGKIVDYVTNFNAPKVIPVAFAKTQTVVLTAGQLASAVNWVLVDATGRVFLQTTRPQHVQRRQVLQLGAVTCSGGVITTVTPAPTYIPQGTLQLYDLLYELGPFVAPPAAGNVVSANGANLGVNKTAGVTFNPSAGYVNGPNEVHYISNPAEAPMVVAYATQAAGSEASPVSVLDPVHYDSGGVVTVVGGNPQASTIQRVYLVPTGVAGAQCVVQYGQAQYASLAAAQLAIGMETFVLNPDLDGTAALLAWVVMTRACTSLQNGNTAAIVRANRFVFP
jgi:hypothetical protein